MFPFVLPATSINASWSIGSLLAWRRASATDAGRLPPNPPARSPRARFRPRRDGTFTLKLTSLPKGDYEFKIAIGGSWAENYGADGAKDGANIPFSVPGDTAPVTLTYDSATHHATALAPCMARSRAKTMPAP